MDTLTVVLIVIAALAAMYAFFNLNKARAAVDKVSGLESARHSSEAKLNATRQELTALKEDNQRKSKSLEEARENAKKKLRKDAQKGDAESAIETNSGDSEVDRLKRTLGAMESQIRSMRDDAQRAEQALKASIESEHAKETVRLKNAIEGLEDQVEHAKGESNKRRQNVAKQMTTPVDLTALPTEVVGELSRLFRKNEQHEKMHGILQGKYQLAQERYQELQRRYFAVCRELALVALPQSESTDEEAQKLAESVVQASDALSAQMEPVAAPSEPAATREHH
jgi:chromosome segregation ATPase